jgi:hypothetical protein
MATARAPAPAPAPRATGAGTPAQAAWLAAIPCAALTIAAMLVLGPPLGDALLAPRGMAFFPSARSAVLPEPTEHARYLLALLGPLLLCGVVVAAARRGPAGAGARALARFVPVVQVLVVAFLAACLWAQRDALGPPIYDPPQRRVYFTLATLVAAGAFAAALVLALRSPAALRRGAALLRDTPARRAGAIAAAVLLLAAWLLMAVNSDATVGRTIGVVGASLSIWLDEAMAVLNGRPPLVDLRAQYAQLWPYASAGAMVLLGTSLSAFVATMLAGTAAAMLAVLALLRRVARSWLAALALFAPFLATSFFMEAGTLADRYTPVHLFSLFPLRYGAAYLLAWLTVRHVDGARPRGRAPLFLLGGLATINNVELGLPALAATLAAVLWTDPPRTRRSAARLVGELALGLAGAVLAVAALTLAVAGSLPRFGLALTFTRMFALEGFGMLPMRTLGLHVVLYATFTAALVVATLRAAGGGAGREPGQRPLTGALAWIGVFGLGAGAYYAGRSHPDALVSLFSAWALALALLLVALVRDAGAATASAGPGAERRWRPSPAALALLVAVGLSVCSLAQTPLPWTQLQRLGRTTPAPVLHPLALERAIAAQARPGERVAILAPVGHRIAHDVGIVDVTPYADVRLIAPRQLSDTIAALRAAGGTRVFLAQWLASDAELAALHAAGFRDAQVVPELQLATLVDGAAPGG